LPSARHGVTFRNITLLPFLARVPRLPKRARTRILALSRLAQIPVSSATHKIAAALARRQTNRMETGGSELQRLKLALFC